MSDQYGSNDSSQYGESPSQYGENSGQYRGNPGQYGAPPNGPQQPPSFPPGPGAGRLFDEGGKNSKGFFGALFDFSFNHFVTPIIIKVVYVLATIVLALAWIIFVIAGFANGVGAGILVLIGGAILALLYLALIRMTLEFYMAVVRMSEDIHKRIPRI